MKRFTIRKVAIVSLIACAAALPAHATNWMSITDDGYVWIDLETCASQDDGRIYCATAQSKQPNVSPDVTGTLMGDAPEVRIAVNCATSEVFSRTMTNFDAWIASNRNIPKTYVWERTDSDYLDGVVRVVCHR